MEKNVESFRMGYHECLTETMHFFVEKEGMYSGDAFCVRAMNHLQKYYERLTKGNCTRSRIFMYPMTSPFFSEKLAKNADHSRRSGSVCGGGISSSTRARNNCARSAQAIPPHRLRLRQQQQLHRTQQRRPPPRHGGETVRLRHCRSDATVRDRRHAPRLRGHGQREDPAEVDGHGEHADDEPDRRDGGVRGDGGGLDGRRT